MQTWGHTCFLGPIAGSNCCYVELPVIPGILYMRVGSRKLVPGTWYHTYDQKASTTAYSCVRTLSYLVPVAKIVEFRESVVISFVDEVSPSRYSAGCKQGT